jgi:hypothetical protein
MTSKRHWNWNLISSFCLKLREAAYNFFQKELAPYANEIDKENSFTQMRVGFIQKRKWIPSKWAYVGWEFVLHHTFSAWANNVVWPMLYGQCWRPMLYSQCWQPMLYGQCCTANVDGQCCTANVVRPMLYGQCCTANVVRPMLYGQCCTANVARPMLYGQ